MSAALRRYAPVALLLLWPAPAAFAQSTSAGSAAFRDISFQGGNGKIAALELTQMKRGSDTVTARTVKLTGFTLSTPLVTVEVPSMVIADFEGESDFVDAVSGGDLGDVAWADALYEAKASRVEIPTLTYRFKQNGGEQITTLSDIVLEDLKEGVGATLTVAAQKSVLTMPDPKQSVTTSVGESESSDVDVAETVRVFEGGGEGEPDEMVSESSSDDIEIQGADFTATIGNVSGGSFIGRAPEGHLTYDEMLRVMAGDADKDVALRRKLGGVLREIAKLFRLESVSAEDIGFKTPEAQGSIAGMEFEGMRMGGIDLFEINKIKVDSGVGPVSLGRFAIEGLDFGPFLDMGLAAMEHDGEQMKVQPNWRQLPKLKAIRLENFDAPGIPQPVAFKEFGFETSETEGVLSGLEVYLKGLKTELDKGMPNDLKAKLLSLGYDEIVADGRMGIRYDADKGQLVFDRMGTSIDKAGSVFATIRFGGFSPDDIIGQPDSVAAASRMIFGDLQIDIADAGLAQRFYDSMAKDAGISADALRDGFSTEMRSQIQASLGDALAPGSADAIRDFLRNPQKLRITVKPRDGAPPITVAEMQSNEPIDLATRMVILIEATP